MSLKDYYQLLDVPPSASADEVRRAFRTQIARYHPDKVQHLGREFQDMAAGRASELTEAYRILSDQERRAEYDRLRAAATAAAPPPVASPPAPEPIRPDSPARAAPPASESAPADGDAPRGGQFTQERATRDEFVRKAVMSRFRQALVGAIGEGYDEPPVPGFDVACVPKSRLFGRKGPRVLGRFVGRVNGEAVTDAWAQAGKWGVPSSEEVCVFLMGSGMAPPRELADAIAKQRRQPARGAKVTVIPVDARTWEAHVPTDAPEVAKNLLARLRGGT